MKPNKYFLGLTIFLSFLLCGQSWGTGYRNFNLGPRSSAMATAVAADTESAEIIFYNPAGLMYLNGVETSFGADFIVINARHKELSGANPQSTGFSFFAIPDFYIGWNPGNERISFGLALNGPYGLGLEWGDSSFAKLNVTKERLNLFNIQPTIAFAFTKKLAIGIGINIYAGSLDFRNKTDVGTAIAAGAATGEEFDSRFKGTGVQQTLNLGAMYKPIEQLTLSVFYRSGSKITFDGDLEITNIPAALTPVFGFGDSASLKAKASLIIPDIVGCGVAYKINPKLKVEVNMDWTKWSSFKTQDLTVTDNALLNQSIPRNWEDSYFYSVGSEWWALNWLAIRLGYAYAENSIPDSTMDASIPDFDRHIIAFGTGIKYRKYTVNFSYNAMLGMANSVQNSVLKPYADLDGIYDTIAHIFSLGLAYTF